LEISINSNEIEKALKLLKWKLQKDGLMQELKKRRFYEKLSALRQFFESGKMKTGDK